MTERGRKRPRGGRTGRVRERPVGPAPAGGGAEPPWRLRFSPRILSDDLRGLGHDAYAVARAAIDKKLRREPRQYGELLRPPLKGLYKLKASHVRVVYHVDEAAREVWILMISDRRVIWDRRQKETLGRLARMRSELER